MTAPDRIRTARLELVRPQPTDAAAIFNRYASDPDVTRFLGWPRHRSIADSEAFLAFSDEQWDRWPAGPYLIRSRDNGELLGGTGFTFKTANLAETGYVLAKDAWGRGYATEALRAIVDVARQIGIARFYALCHAEHRLSWRILETLKELSATEGEIKSMRTPSALRRTGAGRALLNHIIEVGRSRARPQ